LGSVITKDKRKLGKGRGSSLRKSAGALVKATTWRSERYNGWGGLFFKFKRNVNSGGKSEVRNVFFSRRKESCDLKNILNAELKKGMKGRIETREYIYRHRLTNGDLQKVRA